MIRGVSAKTFQNLQLGEGAFLKSAYDGTTLTASQIISATRGGGVLNITPVFRTRTIDGVPTNTKEARTIDYVTAVATFTALEITPELLKMAGAGADYDDKSDKITLRHELKTTDFGDIYWLGDISDGRRVQIIFKSAINTNGIQLTTQQNNEGGLSMQFEANYSVEDLDTPPIEIQFFDAPTEQTDVEQTEVQS